MAQMHLFGEIFLLQLIFTGSLLVHSRNTGQPKTMLIQERYVTRKYASNKLKCIFSSRRVPEMARECIVAKKLGFFQPTADEVMHLLRLWHAAFI
jgi:hypothetical protein